MRASEVLQKCLPNSLSGMHALRERALLHAVEALLHGRRLTLRTSHVRGRAHCGCARRSRQLIAC